MYLIIYGTHTTVANIIKREAKLKEIYYTDIFHLVPWTIRERRQVPEPEPLYEDWYRLMDTVAERSLNNS